MPHTTSAAADTMLDKNNVINYNHITTDATGNIIKNKKRPTSSGGGGAPEPSSNVQTAAANQQGNLAANAAAKKSISISYDKAQNKNIVFTTANHYHHEQQPSSNNGAPQQTRPTPGSNGGGNMMSNTKLIAKQDQNNEAAGQNGAGSHRSPSNKQMPTQANPANSGSNGAPQQHSQPLQNKSSIPQSTAHTTIHQVRGVPQGHSTPIQHQQPQQQQIPRRQSVINKTQSENGQRESLGSIPSTIVYPTSSTPTLIPFPLQQPQLREPRKKIPSPIPPPPPQQQPQQQQQSQQHQQHKHQQQQHHQQQQAIYSQENVQKKMNPNSAAQNPHSNNMNPSGNPKQVDQNVTRQARPLPSPGNNNPPRPSPSGSGDPNPFSKEQATSNRHNNENQMNYHMQNNACLPNGNNCNPKSYNVTSTSPPINLNSEKKNPMEPSRSRSAANANQQASQNKNRSPSRPNEERQQMMMNHNNNLVINTGPYNMGNAGKAVPSPNYSNMQHQANNNNNNVNQVHPSHNNMNMNFNNKEAHFESEKMQHQQHHQQHQMQKAQEMALAIAGNNKSSEMLCNPKDAHGNVVAILGNANNCIVEHMSSRSSPSNAVGNEMVNGNNTNRGMPRLNVNINARSGLEELDILIKNSKNILTANKISRVANYTNATAKYLTDGSGEVQSALVQQQSAQTAAYKMTASISNGCQNAILFGEEVPANGSSHHTHTINVIKKTNSSPHLDRRNEEIIIFKPTSTSSPTATKGQVTGGNPNHNYHGSTVALATISPPSVPSFSVSNQMHEKPASSHHQKTSRQAPPLTTPRSMNAMNLNIPDNSSNAQASNQQYQSIPSPIRSTSPMKMPPQSISMKGVQIKQQQPHQQQQQQQSMQANTIESTTAMKLKQLQDANLDANVNSLPTNMAAIIEVNEGHSLSHNQIKIEKAASPSARTKMEGRRFDDPNGHMREYALHHQQLQQQHQMQKQQQQQQQSINHLTAPKVKISLATSSSSSSLTPNTPYPPNYQQKSQNNQLSEQQKMALLNNQNEIFDRHIYYQYQEETRPNLKVKTYDAEPQPQQQQQQQQHQSRSNLNRIYSSQNQVDAQQVLNAQQYVKSLKSPSMHSMDASSVSPYGSIQTQINNYMNENFGKGSNPNKELVININNATMSKQSNKAIISPFYQLQNSEAGKDTTAIKSIKSSKSVNPGVETGNSVRLKFVENSGGGAVVQTQPTRRSKSMSNAVLHSQNQSEQGTMRNMGGRNPSMVSPPSLSTNNSSLQSAQTMAKRLSQQPQHGKISTQQHNHAHHYHHHHHHHHPHQGQGQSQMSNSATAATPNGFSSLRLNTDKVLTTYNTDALSELLKTASKQQPQPMVPPPQNRPTQTSDYNQIHQNIMNSVDSDGFGNGGMYDSTGSNSNQKFTQQYQQQSTLSNANSITNLIAYLDNNGEGESNVIANLGNGQKQSFTINKTIMAKKSSLQNLAASINPDCIKINIIKNPKDQMGHNVDMKEGKFDTMQSVKSNMLPSSHVTIKTLGNPHHHHHNQQVPVAAPVVAATPKMRSTSNTPINFKADAPTTEYKTSLFIGHDFSPKDVNIQLVEGRASTPGPSEAKSSKKLLVHCLKVEQIPHSHDQPLMHDMGNYLRKELKREIPIPANADINSLESYLENATLIIKFKLVNDASTALTTITTTYPPNIIDNDNDALGMGTISKNPSGSNLSQMGKQSGKNYTVSYSQSSKPMQDSVSSASMSMSNLNDEQQAYSAPKATKTKRSVGQKLKQHSFVFENPLYNNADFQVASASGSYIDMLDDKHHGKQHASKPTKKSILKSNNEAKAAADLENLVLISSTGAQPKTAKKAQSTLNLNTFVNSPSQQQQFNPTLTSSKNYNMGQSNTSSDMGFNAGQSKPEISIVKIKPHSSTGRGQNDNLMRRASMGNLEDFILDQNIKVELLPKSQKLHATMQNGAGGNGTGGRASRPQSVVTTAANPSSTKSVRFDMNNRTFQIQSSPNGGDTRSEMNNGNWFQTTSTQPVNMNFTYSNEQVNNAHQRSTSLSSRSRSPQSNKQRHSSKRAVPSNLPTGSSRLTGDMIQDGFSCITKDGLDNVFLTYFFKLPSCSPADRTQVRIENHNILKLKIIQEKNFSSSDKHKSGSSKGDFKSSQSSLTSESGSASSGYEDDETKIMLREFSRQCRLPNHLFRFDETGVTVSFVNCVWVRVEIPILEFIDDGGMNDSNEQLTVASGGAKESSSSSKKHRQHQHLQQQINQQNFFDQHHMIASDDNFNMMGSSMSNSQLTGSTFNLNMLNANSSSGRAKKGYKHNPGVGSSHQTQEMVVNQDFGYEDDDQLDESAPPQQQYRQTPSLEQQQQQSQMSYQPAPPPTQKNIIRITTNSATNAANEYDNLNDPDHGYNGFNVNEYIISTSNGSSVKTHKMRKPSKSPIRF